MTTDSQNLAAFLADNGEDTDSAPEPVSFRVGIAQPAGSTPSSNGMRYETYALADAARIDLDGRWFHGGVSSVIPSQDPVNRFVI